MTTKPGDVQTVLELIRETILAGESFASKLEAVADELPAEGPTVEYVWPLGDEARLGKLLRGQHGSGLSWEHGARSPDRDAAEWLRQQAHDARKLCEALRRIINETATASERA